MKVPRILLGLLLIFVILEILQILLSPPSYVFAPPSTSVGLVASAPSLFATTWLYTVGNAAAGFAFGFTLATILLFAAYSLGTLGRSISAIVDTLQSFPKEALFPLFVLWIGFGPQTKILNAALLSFIPIFVAVIPALLFPRRDYLQLFRSFGESSRWRELRVLRLPTAVPNLYAGVRLAIPLALVGSVLGEFLGGGEGLGHLILTGSLAFRIDYSFTAVYLLAVTGVLLLEVLDALFLIGWRRFFEADIAEVKGVWL